MTGLPALVLAAGRGRRLRPLTDLLPKPLCPVGNRALLDWNLDQAFAVTPDVTVNVHHGRDVVERHLAERAGGRVRVSVEAEQALGTAGAVGRVKDHVAGRPLLVLNSDAWRPGGLADLVTGWDGERVRLLVVRDREHGDFGELRYAGACLLPWRVIRALAPEPTGLYEVSWRHEHDAGRLDFAVTDAVFVDCGTPADYVRANLAAAGPGGLVDPTAHVTGTAVESVVGPRAVVAGSVARCVVWPDAVVGPREALADAVRAVGGLTVPLG